MKTCIKTFSMDKRDEIDNHDGHLKGEWHYVVPFNWRTLCAVYSDGTWEELIRYNSNKSSLGCSVIKLIIGRDREDIKHNVERIVEEYKNKNGAVSLMD